MKILVLNAGSSSLKFKLYNFPGQAELLQGIAERIGEEEGTIKIGNLVFNRQIENHYEALRFITEFLISEDGPVYSPEEIVAIGHRVVHGGDLFMEPVVIDEKVKQQIKSLFTLAPLHNPPNLTGIETAEKLFPHALQVAVFDTAFHRSIPEYEHRYAIPEEFYKKGIKQYGFHGISHRYVSKKAYEKLGRMEGKLITLHLGNGASATAILNGKSVATSMGFGPLAGLIMGTRSGDIDPSVIFYMHQEMQMDVGEISHMLNKKSGLLALAGANDMRLIEEKYAAGDKKARLALQMYAERIKKYIGSYAAILNGLDALVFTAGIGENSPLVREMATQSLDFLGIVLDKRKNQNPPVFAEEIQADNSRTKIFVIRTNEELEIATQTYQLVKSREK